MATVAEPPAETRADSASDAPSGARSGHARGRFSRVSIDDPYARTEPPSEVTNAPPARTTVTEDDGDENDRAIDDMVVDADEPQAFHSAIDLPLGDPVDELATSTDTETGPASDMAPATADPQGSDVEQTVDSPVADEASMPMAHPTSARIPDFPGIATSGPMSIEALRRRARHAPDIDVGDRRLTSRTSEFVAGGRPIPTPSADTFAMDDSDITQEVVADGLKRDTEVVYRPLDIDPLPEGAQPADLAKSPSGAIVSDESEAAADTSMPVPVSEEWPIPRGMRPLGFLRRLALRVTSFLKKVPAWFGIRDERKHRGEGE